MTSKKLLTLATFLGTDLLQGTAFAAEWNYDLNGADWADLALVGNNCGGLNQSPIDLKTSGWPTINSKEDSFQKLYTD